jgi:hypothetical protein
LPRARQIPTRSPGRLRVDPPAVQLGGLRALGGGRELEHPGAIGRRSGNHGEHAGVAQLPYLRLERAVLVQQHQLGRVPVPGQRCGIQ